MKSLRPVIQTASAIALFVGATVLYANVPTRIETSAPLVIEGTSSDRIAGRNIAIKIRAVYSAPLIRNGPKYDKPIPLQANGRWIVVDFDYETIVTWESLTAALKADELTVDPEINTKIRADPGLPRHSTLVFDVPIQPSSLVLIARNTDAPMAYSRLGSRADSQLDIQIPVSEVLSRPSLDLIDWEIP